MSSPTDTAAWHALRSHSAHFREGNSRLSGLFAADPSRADMFSRQHDNLLLDFSRNYITEDTLTLLLELAREQNVPSAITSMFAGDNINSSEARPALHIALREPETNHRFPELTVALARMARLVDSIRKGDWVGYSGMPIRDVVNLGVGGSDLGPALVVSALERPNARDIAVHFVSNIDPAQLAMTLARLNPETTLFIVASKSFTTLETRHNAELCKQWLQEHCADSAATARHFVAVTTNTEAALAFGIAADNLLPMWDWVGGRFSVWSAIGLPIALRLGIDSFRQLLAGANAMDRHFQNAELADNLPVLLALLNVWYRGFFDSHSQAVVPYCERLRLLPAYLQQLSMESLGKSVDHAEQPVAMSTGEPVWGTVGTDIQHSCFQLLHQGTEFIPVDLIAIAQPTDSTNIAAHQHLLANCLSQGMALMQGHADTQQPSRAIAGNKPSNTLLLSALTPYNLGSLLALYEHKVFVQSVIWDINAFDQWGVELGKRLSQDVYAALSEGADATVLDASTARLIAAVNAWKR